MNTNWLLFVFRVRVRETSVGLEMLFLLDYPVIARSNFLYPTEKIWVMLTLQDISFGYLLAP
jgi:hypothetical protein